MIRTAVPGILKSLKHIPQKGQPHSFMVGSKPIRYVQHFRSAAARRKFEAGEISAKQAFNTVPVYRGLDSRAYRQVMNEKKYKAKLARRRGLAAQLRDMIAAGKPEAP